MDLDEIRKILELMRDNDLAEFELEQDGVKLRLRKDTSPQWSNGPAVLATPGPPVSAQPVASAAGVESATSP